ncbi:MAG: hypothetical protein KBT14_03285 [Proteobacteria bacterium]|nr:hypothetical protein [Candidatus Enterousia onthequi]MCQ2581073.1 hypothetical protein [Alphaproteobacteria bacterium]
MVIWKASYNNGVSFNVYIITDFCNSHGTGGYRGRFPWHGRGCPMGTGCIQCLRI